jgi:hypothetical protein
MFLFYSNMCIHSHIKITRHYFATHPACAISSAAFHCHAALLSDISSF